MEENERRKTRPAEARSLGSLHNLLVKGLPDFVDREGYLDCRAIAEYLGISYQALYAAFSRERISAKRARSLALLSESTAKRPDGFTPLCVNDFGEFFK